MEDIHTLRNKDLNLFKTHSTDNDHVDHTPVKGSSPIDHMGHISLHARKNSFVVIEKNPFKHIANGSGNQPQEFTKRLSNVKSAESLKLELNLQ